MNPDNHTYIAWHCTKCGHCHVSSTPVSSYPVKCPSCGEQSIRLGHPVLPTNSVSRDDRPSRYDFCSNKETIQVYIYSLDGKRIGICLDEEDVPDCTDDPVHVAELVLKEMESWIYYSQLPRLREVVASMKENAEKSDENARLNRIEELKASIVSNLHELKIISQ
jgi:hypothetical protein